jgi:hypothetical protein
MDFKQLDRGEAVAVIGGILLGISVFLSWYSLGNRFASLGSCRGPHTTCSAWSSLLILRFLLLAAAAAPAILAWIIIRGHALSWPRGELTAVTALTALTMILFRGLVDRPGTPPGEISISWGWFVALVGGLLILLGAVARARQGSARRKPPGVL